MQLESLRFRKFALRTRSQLARTADRTASVTADYLVISDCCYSISSCFRDIALWEYWGHKFGVSGSRDVIGHVTIRLAI